MISDPQMVSKPKYVIELSTLAGEHLLGARTPLPESWLCSCTCCLTVFRLQCIPHKMMTYTAQSQWCHHALLSLTMRMFLQSLGCWESDYCYAPGENS